MKKKPLITETKDKPVLHCCTCSHCDRKSKASVQRCGGCVEFDQYEPAEQRCDNCDYMQWKSVMAGVCAYCVTRNTTSYGELFSGVNCKRKASDYCEHWTLAHSFIAFDYRKNAQCTFKD